MKKIPTLFERQFDKHKGVGITPSAPCFGKRGEHDVQ